MRKIVLLSLLMVVAMISTVFADSGLANYGNRSKVMPIIWVSPEDVSDVTETDTDIVYWCSKSSGTKCGCNSFG